MEHRGENAGRAARKAAGRDIAQMVREVVEDPSFADHFEEHLARREVVQFLMARRAAAGLTQKAVADKLRRSQSRISKLENSTDDELRLGDLAGYATALGYTVEIMLTPERWSAVDEVKHHAFCIQRQLDHLAGLAGSDPSIVQGVAEFLREVKVNLGLIVQQTAYTLVAAIRRFGKATKDSEESVPIRIGEKKTELPDFDYNHVSPDTTEKVATVAAC